MGDHRERACRACGSLLCRRDAGCPTCRNCGERGHLSCSRGKARGPIVPVEVPGVTRGPDGLPSSVLL